MEQSVLVLENDAALRELLSLALHRGGVPARCAASGEEAERALLAGGVDFLLLDLNLGVGRSGHQHAVAWAQSGLLPPFLVVTGTPDDPRLGPLRALAAFRGVVAKPFPVLDLVSRVVELRGGAQGRSSAAS